MSDALQSDSHQWFDLLVFLSLDCLLPAWKGFGLDLPPNVSHAVGVAAKNVLTEWTQGVSSVRDLDWSPSVVSIHAESLLDRVSRKLNREHYRLWLRWVSFFFLASEDRREFGDRWAFSLALLRSHGPPSELRFDRRGGASEISRKIAQAPLDTESGWLASDSSWDRKLLNLSECPLDIAAVIDGYARVMRLLQWWREEFVSHFDKDELVMILRLTGVTLDPSTSRDVDLTAALGIWSTEAQDSSE